MVFTDSTVGNYHRYLPGSTYSLVYSAEGYRNDTLWDISVPSDNAVRKDITLTRVPSTTPKTPNLQAFSAWFDSEAGQLRMRIPCQAGSSTWVQLFGMNGRPVLKQQVSSCTTVSVAVPQRLSSGVYLLRLHAPGYSRTQRVMLH